MSMAAGAYVSVSSQSDTEQADLALELAELANISVARGVDAVLAREVAGQLMARDALGAHAHDEFGMSDLNIPRPIQAALTSAASVSIGAAMPLLMVVVAPPAPLALLGAIGALVGRAV